MNHIKLVTKDIDHTRQAVSIKWNCRVDNENVSGLSLVIKTSPGNSSSASIIFNRDIPVSCRFSGRVSSSYIKIINN